MSGQDNFSNDNPKTCPNLLARIKGDNPDILHKLGGQPIRFEDKCPAGASKIALIIDESDDYHFVRADSNGYWSHKPGGTAVTNVDAFGHLIRNPQRACYNYKRAGKGDLNYNIFCSYMCVPRNQPLYMRAGGMIREFFA